MTIIIATIVSCAASAVAAWWVARRHARGIAAARAAATAELAAERSARERAFTEVYAAIDHARADFASETEAIAQDYAREIAAAKASVAALADQVAQDRRTAAEALSAACIALREQIHAVDVHLLAVEKAPLIDASARTTIELQARLARAEEAHNDLHRDHIALRDGFSSVRSQVNRLDDSVTQAHVEAALAEHEANVAANPGHHPPGDARHAHKAVLQRAQRRIRAAGDVEPPHLPELVTAALRAGQ
jgi:chromosome segregation ATPase